METKVCKVCNISKEVINFPKAGTYKGIPSYRGECKDCNRIKQSTNPANKEAQKKYKTSSKGRLTRQKRRKLPEVRAKEREYEKYAYHYGNRKKQVIARINRKLKDPAFYGIWLLKNALRDWAKRSGERKNTKIGNYVGCTKEEFRIHIESQFTPEMNWDNHGEYWEYDHIIPISSAKTMEEAYKLTHYTNIRPLHWLENVLKSNKMPEEV